MGTWASTFYRVSREKVRDLIQPCIFCDLLQDLSHSHVVMNDSASVAVLNVSPASPGHTLVIPRTHVESIWDLDDDTAAALMVTVKSVARLLRERLGPRKRHRRAQ